LSKAAASTVRQRLARWRRQPGRPGKKGPRPAGAPGQPAPPPPPTIHTYSSRQTAWLLFKEEDALTDDERRYVDALLRTCPPLARLQTLARAFRDLMRRQDVAALARWLDAADRSEFPEVHGFAEGLRADRAAVEGGITLPWSQGQVEGQVNRLKTLKRAMYGRAKFDLLQVRLLLAT
jgi:transposase